MIFPLNTTYLILCRILSPFPFPWVCDFIQDLVASLVPIPEEANKNVRVASDRFTGIRERDCRALRMGSAEREREGPADLSPWNTLLAINYSWIWRWKCRKAGCSSCDSSNKRIERSQRCCHTFSFFNVEFARAPASCTSFVCFPPLLLPPFYLANCIKTFLFHAISLFADTYSDTWTYMTATISFHQWET